ncbi:MAG TPA: PKD domain-containing protein [Bacteroidia bacterium]|nr:PKD domain-containing protein [Bacteroidia bacterium]
MLKINRPSFFVCSVLLCAALVFIKLVSVDAPVKEPLNTMAKTSFRDIKEEEEEEGKLPLRDRMDLAMKQEFELTKDPATNTVPRERLYAAYNQMQQRKGSGANLHVAGAIPGMNWVERGPNNFGGRSLAMMIDPNDATKKTIWVGAAGGGLWKTTDITVATPVWIALNDFFANLAVTSITYNPLNTQEMYFGTGESWYNADAIRGDGIWKSTNGGTSWTQLVSTSSSSNFDWVQKIIIHPVTGDVYAATRAGVYRSTNGGTSWTQVLGNGNGCTSNDMGDIEMAADNSFYVGVGSIFSSDGIYKSPSGNAGSWTKINIAGSGLPTTGTNRIELACAPSSAVTVYALVSSGASIQNIYRTTNGGTTWTTCALPAWRDQNCGTPGSDFTRGQAWYDLTAIVDPNNANNMFIGGVDILKTTNGGTSWTQITSWWGGCGYQYVHADQHLMIFEPGSSTVAYFANDGGVWRTTNATAATPAISDRNLGYNVLQFYACAIHPTAGTDYFLAGAQDNGSHKFSSAGINSTIEVTGGDGCFVHIDQNNPQYQFTSYVYNNYYRSTNGGNTWAGVNTGGGSFVNPSDYDNASFLMYAAVSGGNYVRWTNPRTGNTFQTVGITNFGGANVTHVSVSQNTANRVFFGMSNGRVVRVDGANTIASGSAGNWINNGAGMPGGSVSCVAVENGNDNHLLVTYSNYGVNSVWETANGGTSWANLDNASLPDMPVRWALFNPLNNTQAVIATELGVWSTDLLNGAATAWGPSNTGQANVSTHMLQIRSSDNMMIAATHGRGLFSSDVFSPPSANFIADKKIRYTNKTIQFTDASTKSTSWLWNFGDATTSTLKNPTKTYANPGTYTVSLQINGNPVYTATKVAYIQILPNRGTPYTPAAGGNFESNIGDFGPDNIAGTLWQRGNSAVAGKSGTNSGTNAWVTGLTGNYLDNTNGSLMTPNYNFTLAGTYTLRLYRKNSFEIGWDGFRVEYSLDKGDTWTSLGTVAASWYDFANNVSATSFPLNEPYFNATRAAFTLAQWDVSAFSGNPNVAFRMHFMSDVNTVAPGVAVDDFEITGPVNSPLPVELISFTGKAVTDLNLLNWETASENDNKGFEVQRSAAGNDFLKIGFVNGGRNTTGMNAYKFEDREVGKNIYYYRLKQTDYNGNFKYSNIIAIKREIMNSSGVEFIYPNPISDQLNIVLSRELKDPLSVSLYDIHGKKIFNSNITPEQYQVNINLKPFNLSGGMYLIYVVADEKMYSQKLFKK